MTLGLGVVAVVGFALVLWRGLAARRMRDPRWTALWEQGSPGVRKTLAAVEQLTDPQAVQRRITDAMREISPDARFELLRSRHAPRGLLGSAREADDAIVRATIERGALRQRDANTDELRTAWQRLDADLVVCVRHETIVYGILAVQGGRVDGGRLLEIRRFADLLAFKLEMHRLYAELALRERLAAMGSLAAALAHDVRTPLSAIRLSLQMIGKHADALGNDAKLVDVAIGQTDRLAQLAAELLDFARPVALVRKTVSIGSMIDAACKAVAAVALEAGVEVRVRLPDEVPSVLGDAAALERVLVNLLHNAIAVAPRGSDVRVSVRVAERIEVRVEDRGPGIPEDDRDRVFEPFFTTRSAGTGLGLAIVRRIVDAHGGNIAVENHAGRGTTMLLQLAASPPA